MPKLIRVTAMFVVVLAAHVAFGADKDVSLRSDPSGAQIEVNGSTTCTTPCSINVPSYYFGSKRTVFAKHAVGPMQITVRKDGYVTRTVNLTTGPIRWTNLNGVHVYDYYLMTSSEFNIHLEAVQRFFGPPDGAPPLVQASGGTSVASGKSLPTEEIVRNAMPAIVVVSTSEGWGSGFLVSAEGVVVTNAHVVEGKQSATITFAGGRSIESSAVFEDAAKDLALLKIEGTGYPYLRLSQMLPSAGVDVIAIGSPGIGGVALTNTVTKGIVSAVRTMGDETWIQTDASINHGNSGGPLLTLSGQMVGVNTLASNKAEYSGLNFSISSIEIDKLIQSRFGHQLTPASSQSETSVVAVSSTPSSADVEVDGIFLGSTPCEIPIATGDRILRVSKRGFKPFERRLRILPGAKQNVNADLDPDAK